MGQQINWNNQIKNKPTFLGGSEALNETPTGDIDSTTGGDGNGTFTLANTPLAGTLRLYKNGVLMRLNVDYTLSTNTINYVAGRYPIAGGDWHVASYRY